MHRIEKLTFPLAAGYVWVMMTLFGAIVLETFMVYPNVFHDPPESLELGMRFLSVAGPSDFFPPLGFASWVLGAATVGLTLRARGVRWWFVVSLAMIVAEGLVSMAYFWPRNEIMFSEGLSVHSAEYLQQVAREFETWHWRSRLGFNGVAAVTAFVGLLRLHTLHTVRTADRPGVRSPSAVPSPRP